MSLAHVLQSGGYQSSGCIEALVMSGDVDLLFLISVSLKGVLQVVIYG